MSTADDTKRCPSCGRAMPVDASTCTSCAYDFTEQFFPGSVRPETNRLAVASLVLGILWVFALGSIAAVVLGRKALRQINDARGREAGKGLAVAGIVIGYVGLVTTVLLLALLLAAR